MQDEVDYLTKLVSFKTETQDKSELKKCAQYLNGFFKAKNLNSKIITKNGYPNIVATSQKTKKPKIFLQAHMDVVPAQAEQYILKESGDKLHGRGTLDMKFAAASYMKLLDVLGGSVNDYNFGVMITFDEEIGGENGVKALLTGGYGCEVVVLPDSGKNWMLENSAMGVWIIKLSKKGKTAHGSLPDQGINAAEILTNALTKIYQFRDKFTRDDLTITLTTLSSGKAINQVPDYAEAVFDIRYKNKATLKEVESKLEKLTVEFSLGKTTVFLGGCLSVSADDPLVSKFTKIAEEVTGQKIKTGHSKGSTDGRYFCAQNIPCIIIQPDGDGRHAEDEWVDKTGVKDFTEILHRFITGNC